jgi:prepilin-type N-terminal cleavage/methylation domain-containing protein
MKREAGYSLMELMVAVAIMVVISGATLQTLSDATYANEGVTLLANSQENLRAAMNYMVKDIVEAGEGLPQGGITIPNAVTIANPAPVPASIVNRPGPVGGPATFPAPYITLPGIVAGSNQGPAAVTPDPNVPGATLVGAPTDFITIAYADTTILDAANNSLNTNPVYVAASGANPGCGGTIAAGGTSVTFDKACITLPTDNTAIAPGDLIMFTNAQGTTLQTVSGTLGQVVNFAGGDAFALNGSGQPSGTIFNIQNGIASPGGPFPPTTCTRIWMITYYLNTANLQRPMLMRQVNFRPATPVAEVIEDLAISYDINGGPPSAPTPEFLYSPSAIRKVNLSLASRSDNAFSVNMAYFRNNLQTQVSVRSLAFFSNYQ